MRKGARAAAAAAEPQEVNAANPRAALAVVDEALDCALMTTCLFEEFDVTGKVLRVAPLQQADRIHQQPAGTGPASV
jgi:hypothetical protein